MALPTRADGVSSADSSRRSIIQNRMLVASVFVNLYLLSVVFVRPTFDTSNMTDRKGSGGSHFPNLQQDGWKSVSIYYGPTSEEYVPTGPAWHSQHQQDEEVVDWYEKLGNSRGRFFVDLAANEPAFISNTLALERDYGWHGVCIEPKASQWLKLAHRTCHVVGAVVEREPDQNVTFRLKMPLGHSGIVAEGMRNKPDDDMDKCWADEKRKTTTLIDILTRARAPHFVDYLSLDVEGAEDHIMSTPRLFDEYQFGLITIEDISEKVKGILKSNGYHFVKTLGVDELWAYNKAA